MTFYPVAGTYVTGTWQAVQHVQIVAPGGVIKSVPGPMYYEHAHGFSAASLPKKKARQLSLDEVSDTLAYSKDVMVKGLQKLVHACEGQPVNDVLFGFMHGTIAAVAERAQMHIHEVTQEQYGFGTRLVVKGHYKPTLQQLVFSVDVM